MPRRRKNFRKRSAYYRYGKYMSTGAKALMLGSSALKLAKRIKTMVNVEYKSHDEIQTENPTTTGGIISLTNVIQGDSSIFRDGNQIKMTSFNMKYRLTHNASGNAYQTVRMILFLDRQNNNPGSTDPSVSGTIHSILDNATIPSQMKLSNAKRYKVLLDKTYNLQDGQRESITGKYFKKFKGIKIRYESGTTNPARENNLWLLTLSNVATNTPAVQLTTRVRFVDN